MVLHIGTHLMLLQLQHKLFQVLIYEQNKMLIPPKNNISKQTVNSLKVEKHIPQCNKLL